MGTDCVKPFIEDCKKYDKGIFILAKTSNPSSGELQDLKIRKSKRSIYTNSRISRKMGRRVKREIPI